MAGKWNLKFSNHSWIREIHAATSVSWQWEKMRETKSVSLNRPAAIATQTETGESDGIYLPYNYVAQMEIDGKPLYVTVSARTHLAFPLGGLQNRMNLGVEWNYQKNLGKGQVFDVTRPISEGLSTRPRRFKDIPGLQPFAFYAEEVLNLPVKRHKLAFTAGIRLQSLLGLDRKYEMQGKIYPDLRLDLQWSLPTSNGWNIAFREVWAGSAVCRLPHSCIRTSSMWI